MLRIYFGDTDKDKDKFIFDQIASVMPSDVFLLVPDQFTLQAERNAFEYMNADALLELEIVSRSGFARRIVSQEGSPGGVAVDKYGRFMLLTGLLLKEQKEEGIFASVRKKNSFISLVNDMISDMKQYDVTPSELAEIESSLNDDSILCEKISDVREIYEKYEELLAGRYLDSEDFLRIVSEKIRGSELVKSHRFWIDGFDYMTPKLLSMVEAIACTAPEVNVVFTGDDRNAEGQFAVFQRMRKALREMAERAQIPYQEHGIPEKYRRDVSPPRVNLTVCSDFYAEAETAAVRITELVREKGLRYRDIVIICNDAEVRGSIFRRVFDRYEIPLFIDRKRGILQDPAVEFIFAMMDTVRDGRRFYDVFRMMKTGYSPVSHDECEELENYCSKYHIRSGRWKKPFVYGMQEEGEEKLNRLNQLRETADAFIRRGEELFQGRKTVREKTEALYLFLTQTAQMPQKIDAARAALEEGDEFEYAESAAQIWKVIVAIFDQIVEVIGEEELTDEEYAQILIQGFSEVEIGLLPTTNDQVLFGTMQRTRTGSIKALFVCGANEGVLPETASSWGIFSEDEKQFLSERNRRICSTDELRDMEQQLAMYKMISKAEDYLFVSWAEIDTEGAQLRPSELIAQLRERSGIAGTAAAAEVSESRDVLCGRPEDLIQNRRGALPHLTEALRKTAAGEALDDVWKTASLFYEGDESYENIRKGLFFDNKVERLSEETVRELYGRGISKELVLSASSLERFCRCPFSFMITYGLRPSEERNFEVDLRSIGDIYHFCLMRLSEYLTDEGVEITGADSRWMKVTEEECRRLTDRFADEFSETYREGVFRQEGRESYLRNRIKEVCFRTAWMMVRQVQCGRTKAIYFEKRFGRRGDAVFPPVRIELQEGRSIYIEGMIDRVDILSPEPEFPLPAEGETADFSALPDRNYIRIIDYKSGGDKFDIEEVRSGFRLQLMLYLRGAMGGIEKSCPAGVFYFKIPDKMAEVSDVPQDQVDDAVRKKLKKETKLDGALLCEERVIECMDGDFTGYSDIIPVYKNRDGGFSGPGLLTEEEFRGLIDENDRNLQKAASEFAAGRADIEPMKTAKSDACRYCGYRSICTIQRRGGGAGTR
ncbi:MAG: PD-(D/E)XK nuclease family protein [Anaerovoracaceae bacterium]